MFTASARAVLLVGLLGPRLLLALTAFQVFPPHLFGDVAYTALVANGLDLDLLEKIRIYSEGQFVFGHARIIRLHVLACQRFEAQFWHSLSEIRSRPQLYAARWT